MASTTTPTSRVPLSSPAKMKDKFRARFEEYQRATDGGDQSEAGFIMASLKDHPRLHRASADCRAIRAEGVNQLRVKAACTGLFSV